MKRRAKRALKKHYILFMTLCLIAAYIGTEFTSSLGIIVVEPATKVSYVAEPGEELYGMVGYHYSFTEVVTDILAGREEEGKEISRKLKEEAIARANEDNPAFGRSRGVFAKVLNSVTSGSIYLSILAAVNSIVGSENAALAILILLGLAVIFAAWFFLTNMFSVIIRRMFLEGRTYQKVPFQRTLFLLRIKKWTKVSCTMFIKTVFYMLWCLTVVGGVVKYYSYYLVPYIVAENPDIPAKEAISLSRRMMKGHKWQCFTYELSFIGWFFLSGLTGGLSAILYSNPYREAFFSEFYAELREEAKKERIKGYRYLNDTYLFEKAEEEMIYLAYEDVISALVRRPQDMMHLKGVRRFFAEYLGILLTNSSREREYEEAQAERVRVEFLKDAVDRMAYPGRLSAVPEVQKRKKVETIHYLRHYSIWSLAAMFFIFSFIGWIWEVSLHLIGDGEFVNRGVLFGPWLPIYGVGGVLILVALHRLRKRPLLEFAGIVILCGTVEYAAAWYLEMAHNGQKWWDYSGYFLNINGRVCAEGLLVFGLGGIGIVYFLAPMLDNLIQKIRIQFLVPVCVALVVLFTSDTLYSIEHPNTGRGITDYESSAPHEYAIDKDMVC